MGTTPNYEFNVPVGSDIVNLLTQLIPNWSNLDTILKTISNTGVGTATELKTGTVHSLTRSDTGRKVFTFVATTNFVAGETFLLDGEQVTALTASGEQLSTGCYVIGSNVLVSVHDTLLTFYVPESTAKDAQKLGGELPSHYATEADLEEIQTDMSAVETKLGTGVFQTQAQNAVDAVNELNTQLTLVDISSQLVSDTPVGTVNAKSMRRMGNLIELDFSVTLNQTLANGSAIFGGLPKPLTNGTEQFTFTAINGGIHTPILFHYVNGYLGAIYPQSGVTSNGSVITGHVMYIAE